MSILRASDNPDWIKTRDFTKKELEVLKDIFPFYVVNTLHESYSYRGIPVTSYGWPDNVWNTGILKEQLFHVANLSNGYNLFIAERLEEMSDACNHAHMGDDFYRYRDQERIAIYVNNSTNLVLSIFKHIRNALAHGRFVMYPSGDDMMIALESVDNHNKALVLKARMVLRASTLLHWKNIITKGPQENIVRKRKKK